MLQEDKISITGKFLKIARMKDEWYEDIVTPEATIKSLKDGRNRTDIFTFWQRLPETEPKYKHYMEWEYLAAIAITSYESWLHNRISSRTRNLTRKANKSGIIIKRALFDEEFVKGMENIFNESPVRQGRPFPHYGKNFKIIEKEFSKNLHREHLIGAYYNGELIGFVFLANGGKYGITTQIISKIEHRDKAINNALVAEAVRLCEEEKIAYLVYGRWGRGSYSEFKRRCGFERIRVPRYYVGLTWKGKLAIKARMHNGISGIIPEKMILSLIEMRSRFYGLRKGKKVEEG